MKNLNGLRRVKALSALVSATSLVVACGGGSDAPAPSPSAFTVTGKAVDGPLQGVTACYDSNDNQACDSGEPVSAATGADGSFTIANIAPADIGKHRVIVDVPASAVAADTGQAVGAAFTMAAPATGVTGDHSVFVSPLTTLVQQQMETSGQTAAQSSDFIKSLLGLEVSPLADFTAAANSDNAKIANAAKLVLQVQRQQAAAVASAVGQTDISGAAITQTDLDRAVLAGLVEALPSIGAVASDAAVLALTGTAREQQLTAAAASVVAQLALTPDQARFAIGLPRLPALPPQSSTPTAGASLVALQYTNAANWFMRANQSTALDNTPDANGLVKFFDVRTRMAPYAYQPDQGVAESFTRTTNPRAVLERQQLDPMQSR